MLSNNHSQINNAVLSNHSNQQESLADQPGIDEEINYPIAASNSSQPKPNNLKSSGLSCLSRTKVLVRCGLVYSNTTLMDQDKGMTKPQNCTLVLGKPMKFLICPRTFLYYLPFWWIVMLGSISCGKSPSIFNTDSFTPCLHIVCI